MPFTLLAGSVLFLIGCLMAFWVWKKDNEEVPQKMMPPTPEPSRPEQKEEENFQNPLNPFVPVGPSDPVGPIPPPLQNLSDAMGSIRAPLQDLSDAMENVGRSLRIADHRHRSPGRLEVGQQVYDYTYGAPSSGIEHLKIEYKSETTTTVSLDSDTPEAPPQKTLYDHLKENDDDF